MIPHNRLTFSETEALAAAEAVRSGWWVGGCRLAAFEKALETTFSCDHAVAVGSGLGALRLALKAVGVGPGREVVVPAYSCVALANAVLSLGAAVVVADVVLGSWNISAASAAAKMTLRTAAIIAVHTFGADLDVTGIASLGVPVIEDFSHGFPFDGTTAGAVRGAAAILSLHATKLIGAGEGGAVLTADSAIAATVRHMRDYADKPADGTFLNDKMTDIEAAIGLCQLDRLPATIKARSDLADRYQKHLKQAATTGSFALPPAGHGRIWYRYAVELTAAPEAAEVATALRKRGIGAALPVDCWADLTDCPIAQVAYRNLISLPLYPTLTTEEQDQVLSAFLEIRTQ
ncbi:MAG TPA: DegT/DnrJ/EryC1/StrS aminotransferase family protein [Candidatus Sulfotelmatobacter sp.]|jgi:dTDP-4-amino-4,6-dideoxygalactose transaminase|nr:DegT/DnrJ/EryC1/StrS aminotransferase family protein [Candidatus Sulfotelmatobacter sp.]